MGVSYSTTMRQLGNNTGVPVPPEVLDELGGGKRPAVRVSVNGFEYAGTVGAMGGEALISFSSEKRAASGIAGGDAISVTLELDTSPRTVEVPEDLAAALAAAGVADAFAKLAPSRRRADAQNVAGAATSETRERRIKAIVAKLS